MPTTTQTTTLPETLNNALQYILSEGMNVYQNTPYEAYQYPRVAPLSQYQQQAFQGVQNAQGNWQPANSQAQSMAQQVLGSAGGMANPSFERVSSPLIASQVVGAAQFPQADISRYMNPYESLVTGAAVRNLEDAAARQQANADARFAKSGAFGGSRQGLYDANLSTQVARQAGELTNQSRAQNYTNAQGVWQNDANRLLQADTTNMMGGLTAAQANANNYLTAARSNADNILKLARNTGNASQAVARVAKARAVVMLSNCMSIWLPARSVSDWLLPRYGTCTALAPRRFRSSSVVRCCEVPAPLVP